VLLLFVLCVTLHARLYDLRPGPQHLTLFYFIMSVGGALGGLFCALIAPLAFDWAWEHPILVVAAAMLLPLPAALDWPRRAGIEPGLARIAMGLLLAIALGMCWLLWDARGLQVSDGYLQGLTIGVALCGFALSSSRIAYLTVLLSLLLVTGGVQTIKDTMAGVRSRSYFGIYTVRDYTERNIRTLTHGTTLHGEQSLDPSARRLPLTYYGPGSGAGIAFSHASELYGPGARLAVVGLGTGSLACYARPGEQLHYFEIDPTVLDYSRRGTFSFIRDCAPQAKVTIGDARIELAKVDPGSFDILAVDAFSSDAIPLHLLTDEAFGVYLDALSPNGVLLVHISNRYIELQPVLAAAAKKRGLVALLRDDVPPSTGELTASSWVLIARNKEPLDFLAKKAPAMPLVPLSPPAARPWTDDHASILPYIRWQNMIGRP
jgi:SAM-dependent methyltransferase